MTVLTEDTLSAMAGEEVQALVRAAALEATGGNCTSIDDDILLLATLARRAIKAGLTEDLAITLPSKDIVKVGPTPRESTRIKLTPFPKNDVGQTLWEKDPQFYKTGCSVPLLDLSRDTTRYGYDRVDRTNLIARGGRVTSLILALAFPSPQGFTTEYFLVDTQSNPKATFGDSGIHCEQNLQMDLTFTLNASTCRSDGSASVLAQNLSSWQHYEIGIDFRASVNLATGNLIGQSNVGCKGPKMLVGNIIAFTADLYFD